MKKHTVKKVIATALVVGLAGCSSLGGKTENGSDTSDGSGTEQPTDGSEANSGGSMAEDPGFDKMMDIQKETQDANSSVQESQEMEKDLNDATSGL